MAKAEEEWPVEGMTEEEAVSRWPELPRNERIRRANLSVIAKQRHSVIVNPETGQRLLGGPQPGSGRPKRKRVAERVAELAQGARQEEVVNALFSGLSRRESAATRVRTAAKIVEIEHQERELQLKEDEFDGKPVDELRKFLAPILARLQARGELPNLIGQVVDGTVASEETIEHGGS